MEINKMIYSALTTKWAKKCKYEQVLKALGYELFQSTSEQGYYGVKHVETNRELFITKNWENKTILYFEGENVNKHYLSQQLIKKLDFQNMIGKTYYERVRGRSCSKAIVEFENNKFALNSAIRGQKYHTEAITKIEQQIEREMKRLREEIAYHKESYKRDIENQHKYEKEIDKMLKRS